MEIRFQNTLVLFVFVFFPFQKVLLLEKAKTLALFEDKQEAVICI